MNCPANEPTHSQLGDDRKRELKKRLMSRASAAMQVSRVEEADWQRFLPGVEVRVLHHDVDNATQTALWRLAAGASIPPHPHHQDEECLILEGSLTHRGVDYRAGDYMLAPAGSRHDSITSRDGAIMLIRGEAVS